MYVRDNLQEIVDEIRSVLARSGGAFYKIQWHDGRVLELQIIPDGISSILRWRIDTAPWNEQTVDPKIYSTSLYVWIRAVMSTEKKEKTLS